MPWLSSKLGSLAQTILMPGRAADPPRNHSSKPSSQHPVLAATTGTARPPDTSSVKRAVVVGSGPAGSLASLYLAKRGWKVDVFDQRPKLSPANLAKHRSYNMVLSSRGTSAIEGAGAQPLGTKHRLRYLAALPLGGCTSASSVADESNDDSTVAIDRLTVVRHLISEAQRLHPEAITFHWEHAFEGADYDTRQASFKQRPAGGVAGAAGPAAPEAGDAAASGGWCAGTTFSYDLLLAADGIHSGVRQNMMDQGVVPGLKVTQLHSNASACKYRTFTGVPATPAMAQWGAQALKLPPEQLQLSDPGDGAWRGKVAWWFRAPAQPIEGVGSPGAVVYTNADGTFKGVVSMAGNQWDWVRTPEDCRRLLGYVLPPDFDEALVGAIADSLMQGELCSFNTIQRVSTLAGPSVVLLGDAGHSVTPSAGMGCNSALEDCAVLDQVLQAAELAASEASGILGMLPQVLPAAAGGSRAEAGSRQHAPSSESVAVAAAAVPQMAAHMSQGVAGGLPLGDLIAQQYNWLRLRDAHAVQDIEQMFSSVVRRQEGLPLRLRLHYGLLHLQLRCHMLVARLVPGLLATGQEQYNLGDVVNVLGGVAFSSYAADLRRAAVLVAGVTAVCAGAVVAAATAWVLR